MEIFNKKLIKFVDILDVSESEHMINMVDIEVEDDHSFCLSNGVVSHNSAGCAVLSARTEMIGCYPLKGKPINVMGASQKDILANKEFVELMLVTGLKIGHRVESIDDLRFGKIVILTDADPDGKHCAGLICTMIKKFWPELFTMNVVYRFDTPLAKVEINKKELYFYSLEEFDQWVEANKAKKFTTRYLKGLGSSTAKDFKKYFENMDKHLSCITIKDVSDLSIVDLVFGKESGAADKRKVWLDLEDQTNI